MSKLFKRDLALILAIIIAALALWGAFAFFKKDGESVEIRLRGELFAVLPLNKNAELDVEGLCTVVVENGKAFVKNSTCRNKICENHRPISRAGETVACLPNGVTLRVSGEGGADFYV